MFDTAFKKLKELMLEVPDELEPYYTIFRQLDGTLPIRFEGREAMSSPLTHCDITGDMILQTEGDACNCI